MTEAGGRMFRGVVIGGGLSGLAAAYLLEQEAAAAGIPLAVTLLEADERTGGKIGTVESGGFRCEIGPNGFLDSKPATLDLVRKMGFESHLLRSNDSARKRFIFSDNRLQQLPEDPLSFLRSELISIRGRLRIGAEYLVPQRRGGGDETLADFVRRRLGQEALDKLIDPMASGIFAGNPENMSLAACFPKIVALEEAYGGLLKGMLAMRRQASAAGRQGPESAGPGGVLMSFHEGLEELIVALQERIGTVRRGTSAQALAKRPEGGFRVTLGGGAPGETLDADVVILAVPAYDAAALFEPFDPGIASTMRTIPYAAMAVVHVGYPESSLPRPLDGFGFLVPHRERRRILGSLWASSIFKGRAPEGHVLLTVMAGGALDAATPRRPENEILDLVREELAITMGIRQPPVFSRVFPWERAIPQYTVGHPDRVASLERRMTDHPGLFITGNAFRGIGVNDCVASGQLVARAAVGHLGRGGATRGT